MLLPDEGYFFGIGAFETIAVEEGKPILLEEHYARLARAMEFLDLKHSMQEVRKKGEEVLKRPDMQEGRKVLKITVSGENIVATSRENTYTSEDYERGFSTAYSKVIRNETSAFTYHKTLNYGDCLLEKSRAKVEGIDEPIFLNTKGKICEGASTNVFFVKAGEIYTPPEACGLLPGIMREYICSHYPVKKRVIYPEDVWSFDEMFLTNSLLGIMPVINLEKNTFSSRETGLRLLEEYQQYCKFNT